MASAKKKAVPGRKKLAEVIRSDEDNLNELVRDVDELNMEEIRTKAVPSEAADWSHELRNKREGVKLKSVPGTQQRGKDRQEGLIDGSCQVELPSKVRDRAALTPPKSWNRELAALADILEKLDELAAIKPESIFDTTSQLKDISQEVRAVFASKVAVALNQFAGEPHTLDNKREIAKQVNAMLRDWGLQLQSPTGEPVPLVVNPGGERDREGVFIVGRGAGSVTTRYPEVVLMPAPPKTPRGE